jgi:hypothetical protein
MANIKWSAKNVWGALNALANNAVLPAVNPGAPTGTTLAGHAGKGCLLIDTTNGVLYINTGTKATPTWTKVGTQT